MNLATTISPKRIGIGLAVLLAAAPLGYAQRQEPARGGAEAPRQTEAPRAPVQRQPAVVNRTSHGSIRHADTNVIQQRPVQAPRGGEAPHGGQPTHAVEAPHGGEAPHGINQYQHVVPHHDVDVDFGRPRFWHNFHFGDRVHGLRPGYIQIYVSGIPFFYDDGIYYQQAGEDYQEVYPPVGADVQDLPDGAIEIDAGNIAYYYAGGAFYVQQGGGYVIAPNPIGVTVPELPPGAVQVSYNGGVAYQFNGIYYQPEFVDGVTQYVTFQP